MEQVKNTCRVSHLVCFHIEFLLISRYLRTVSFRQILHCNILFGNHRATGVVTASPDSVLLAGKANILNNLSVIDIPDTEIDITGARENVVTVVDVDKYIPASVNPADGEFDDFYTPFRFSFICFLPYPIPFPAPFFRYSAAP